MARKKLKYKVGDIVRCYTLLGEDGDIVDKANRSDFYTDLIREKTKLIIKEIREDEYSENRMYPYVVERLDKHNMGEHNRFCDRELKSVDEPISNWKSIIQS